MFETTNQQSCLSLWDGTGPKKIQRFHGDSLGSWPCSICMALTWDPKVTTKHTPCVIPSNSSEKKLSFMVFRAEFSKHQANVKLRQTNGTKHHLALRLRRNLGICHQWQSVTPSLGVNSPLLIVLKIGHLRAVSGSSLGNMLGIGQKHNSKTNKRQEVKSDPPVFDTGYTHNELRHILICLCATDLHDLLVDAIFPVFLVQTYSIFCSNLPLSSFVVFPPDIHLLIIIWLNRLPTYRFKGQFRSSLSKTLNYPTKCQLNPRTTNLVGFCRVPINFT